MTDDMQKYLWELTDEEREEIRRLVEEEIRRALIAPVVRQRMLDYIAMHEMSYVPVIHSQYIDRIAEVFRTLISHERRSTEPVRTEGIYAAR